MFNLCFTQYNPLSFIKVSEINSINSYQTKALELKIFDATSIVSYFSKHADKSRVYICIVNITQNTVEIKDVKIPKMPVHRKIYKFMNKHRLVLLQSPDNQCLTLFFPSLPFDPVDNIRKSLVITFSFLMFVGDSKGNCV